jgi:transcriptional regulator NrdR family protein
MIACPHCGYLDSRVKETKVKKQDDCVVRYRTCKRCHADFPTHERTVSFIKASGWVPSEGFMEDDE